MKILVLIKQVPTGEVRVDKRTGTLIRRGTEGELDGESLAALEQALRLRDKYPDIQVAVMTMGTPDAKLALLEAEALGADEAFLLTDRCLAGSDAAATGYALCRAIQAVGMADLILMGSRSADAGSCQIGARVAAGLGLPLVSEADWVDISGGGLITSRLIHGRRVTGETALPAVASVVCGNSEPRILTAAGIVDACRTKPVTVLSAADADIDPSRVGLSGSFSCVVHTVPPEKKGHCERIEGPGREAAQSLVEKLQERNLLSRGNQQ